MEETKVCKGCGGSLPLSSYGTYLYKHRDVCERRLHGKCKKCSSPTPSKEEIDSRIGYYMRVGRHTCPSCNEERPIFEFSFHKTGHNAGRPVSRCKACHVVKQGEWRRGNPEKASLINAKSYKNNREKRLTDDERAKRRAWTKVWAKANPHKTASIRASRRASKKSATPAWADVRSIQEVYKKCAEWSKILGVPLSVDHVVPLKSQFVCGLHVQDNLQVMERGANSSKGNLSWPDMPEITPELKQLAKEFYAKTD